jgi:L-lactate dehydrogenase
MIKKEKKGYKVVVVGAGQVGATFAFNLMITGIATEIVLIDLDKKRAEGHVLDMNHGLPFVPPTKIVVGAYEACHDADVVVITAGVAQRPGESRLELTQRNTDIFKKIIPSIVTHNPKVLLIVSNPVDVLTYVTLQLSDYPANQVIGSGTVLDSARFRYLLGQHCQVDPRNVHGYIIGEHGDSEVPVWSRVNIGGILFRDYCKSCSRPCPTNGHEKIFEKVKKAAYEVIARKGATYYAISLSLIRIVGSILRDERSVLPVSILMEGYLGITDVCLSLPAIVGSSGVEKILEMKLEEKEAEQLHRSVSVLKEIIRDIGF